MTDLTDLGNDQGARARGENTEGSQPVVKVFEPAVPTTCRTCKTRLECDHAEAIHTLVFAENFGSDSDLDTLDDLYEVLAHHCQDFRMTL